VGTIFTLGLTFLAGMRFRVRCRLCRVQGVPVWLLSVSGACWRAWLRCLPGRVRGDGCPGLVCGAMAALW
jgi:hypothetical protein